MFLSGMSIKTDDNEHEIFTILIPAEKLFEDFIFGFIQKEFQYKSSIKAIRSQSDQNGDQVALAEEKKADKSIKNSFKLKPDIYISKELNDIILDTKYKVIYTKEEALENEQDQNGVSLSDVYQMLAYTVKLEVNVCHLLYPGILGVADTLGSHYEITHKNRKEVSKIYYHRIPTLIENEMGELVDIIEEKEKLLFNHLNNIIIGGISKEY
jgi:5-methylcytosine-specific restriction enzyme subunit McrC